MRRVRTLGLLAAATALVAVPTSLAAAASITYIEDGNVWVASPDGAQRLQLTTDGTPQHPWYTPSQSGDGRTFAVQSMSALNHLNTRVITFSAATGVPTANVTQLVDASQSSVTRPLAGDVTDDGVWQIHEASYCVGGYSGAIYYYCLSNPSVGWLTPTQQDWGIMKPFGPSGARQPTFWGSRVVASDGTGITLGEGGSAAQLGGNAVAWVTPASGYKMKRADVPPAGGKIAIETVQTAPAAGQPANMISVIPFAGSTEPPTLDPANGCDMPQVGPAHSVAWSPDGTKIAWRDDRGLVVSGAPVLPSPVDSVCRLASPVIVITSRPASASADNKSATVYSTLGGPSFGGADVGAMIAAREVAAPPVAPAPSAPAAVPTVTRGPVTAPSVASLSAPIGITVMAVRAGTITAAGRIPAAVARRLKLPVVIARGTARAKKGQKVVLSLRPTAKAKRAAAKLKGVTMTVQVTLPGRPPIRVPIQIG